MTYPPALLGGMLIGLATTVLLVAKAGLLVGFGTRLGSGCTSGHGVVVLGLAPIAVFVAAMMAGMLLFRWTFGADTLRG